MSYGMDGWNKENRRDLISREAAIDDLHGKDPSQIWDTADIEVWVNALPSAQPTDADIQRMQDIEQAMLEKAYECGKQDAAQWIPCSEKLPEINQTVLLSTTDGEVIVGYRYKPDIVWQVTSNDGRKIWVYDPENYPGNIDELPKAETCGFENRDNCWLSVTSINYDLKFAGISAWMPLPEIYREDVNDTISRQAALNACKNPEDGENAYAFGDDIEKRLMALPSAQPEQRWIPCSTRLPEKPNVYTVTDSNDRVVRFAFTGTDSSREYWKRCAKAWMPLPEPYSERRQE